MKSTKANTYTNQCNVWGHNLLLYYTQSIVDGILEADVSRNTALNNCQKESNVELKCT